MAVFDTNLMLRNTTETVGTNLSFAGGLLGFTSNWLTLGTHVKGPINIRVSVQTCMSNTDTMDFHFEQSDDQSKVSEDLVWSPTGTDLGALNLAWTTLSAPDNFIPLWMKRRYLRARMVGRGLGFALGTVTIGVDAGDKVVMRD